jgi:hypothetical protein
VRGGSASAAAGASGPPFSLLAGHFGAALCFFILGAAGLVWVAPDLAAGRYLVPRVVAVTHLFTLGWITTSIMGALNQLFPVVLGTSVRSTPLAYAGLLVYAPGLALFVGAMLAGHTGLMVAGAAAFSAGLLLFVGNAAAGLRAAPQREVTWWALSAALAFLVVTVVLGMSLAGNLRWHYLGAERLTALGVHMHVALGGWVLLVAMGVGRRLLPMFLLSHDCVRRPGAVAVVLTGAGAGTLTLLHHMAGAVVSWVAAVLFVSGVAAFLVEVVVYVRRSHRPRLDPGLRLALTGMAFLAAALPLGVAALILGFASGQVNAAYGTALVAGAFTLFVAGHYYKILPFLVWNHRFAPLVGSGRKLPLVADLFDTRVANAAFGLMAAGAVALVAAVLAGHGPVARAAATIFALGAAIEFAQMIAIYRTQPES